MGFDQNNLARSQIVWIVLGFIGVIALLFWGLSNVDPTNKSGLPAAENNGVSSSSTANARSGSETDSTVSRPDGDQSGLEREREHLQWMKKGFRENEQLADQLLHDPRWVKQWPLIADFQSDADAWYQSWARRCDQESAHGSRKRLGQCDTAMTFAITGFEVTVVVLKNFSPIQKQAVIDWPEKLREERQEVSLLVHKRITNSKEQMMLYSELDRSASYDDQIRDLLRRDDYDGSRILLGHSESIKDAVFAETAHPPSN